MCPQVTLNDTHVIKMVVMQVRKGMSLQCKCVLILFLTYASRSGPTYTPGDTHQDTPPSLSDRGRYLHNYRRFCRTLHRMSQ